MLWFISLAGVGLLAISSDILFTYAATYSENYAHVVNQAGLQRTLSLNISIQSTRLVYAQLPNQRSEAAADLRRVIDSERAEYEGLLALTASNSRLHALYGEGSPIHDAIKVYLNAAETLLRLPPEAANPLAAPYLYISKTSPLLLNELNSAVQLLMQYNDSDNHYFHMLNNVRMVIIFSVIVAQYLMVLRPTIRQLREYTIELENEVAVRKMAEAALSASETRFRALAEAIPAGVYRSDATSYVTWGNLRWKSMMGLPDEMLYGRGWEQAVHPDDIISMKDPIHMKELAEYDMTEHEFRIVHPDGRVIHIHAYVTLERDEQKNMTGILGTLVDVTQRKHIEEQTIRLEAERQRVQILGNFIRDTSHDLRTPLTVIKTSLYLARKSETPEKLEQRLDTIENQVDYLNIAIEQLQKMAKLDSVTEIEMRMTHVPPLIQDTINSIFNLMDGTFSRPLNINIADNLPALPISQENFIYALHAILDNAMRNTDAGDAIEINAAVEGDHLVLRVRDFGYGISEEHFEHIFNRFYKIDTSRSGGGGAGLGLPFVKRVMELHHGSVEATSAANIGTTITLRFPLNPAS